MEILQFPVEILMKIFSFLPSYANISLVNKKCYDVVRKIADPRICLTVTSNLFVSEIFFSISIDFLILPVFIGKKEESIIVAEHNEIGACSYEITSLLQ